MDFGWPNVEIAWKMANGWLLFLALLLLTQLAWWVSFRSFQHNTCKYELISLVGVVHIKGMM